MVHVVVRVVVDQVAEDEAGEERVGGGRAEDQREAEEEERRERDRDGRWHHQPQLVVGMVVVDAVDDEVHLTPEGVVWLPMEDEPVQPVLGQGPDRDAGQAEPDQLQRAVAARRAEPLHSHHHRHEDDRRDRRMHPGEEVEEVAVEQLRGRRELVGTAGGVHPRQW